MLNAVSIRRRRKQARPAEIVEAAREVFVDKGFAAAKIDDIAARARVSKGTVYLYFPTKEALFEEVVRANVLTVIESASAMLMAEHDMPAPTQLRLMLEFMYRELVGTERRRLMHLIVAEGPRFPWLSEFYHREFLSRGKALITAVLRRGEARGEFALHGLDRYPKIVIAPALMAGLYTCLFEAYDPIDLDDYCRVHVSAMLRTLGVEEDAG